MLFTKKTLLDTFEIEAQESNYNYAEIVVNGCELSVNLNDKPICTCNKILPTASVFQPKKDALMNIGICQGSNIAYFKNITVTDIEHDCILKEWNFKKTILPFGTIENELLAVRNCFELLNPTPAINVLRNISVAKPIKSARLYATAFGFYNAYINDKKIGDLYYAPGFTDYRKRVQYQCYDISDMLTIGDNLFIATITKGYYTGFCNYTGPMIYGTQNFFMAKLVIRYFDGNSDVIVTDDKWLYTEMGPVVDSDYLDGETYDARLSLTNAAWEQCGTYNWPKFAEPSNGKLTAPIPFRVSPEICDGAKERKRINAKFITENPKGHYIYDCGQNLTGTIMLTASASKGMSIKIRYGEMCYKSGEIYVRNLRSAANTDIYTFSSDKTETFTPAYTSHGFRYIEITGNGFTLSSNSFIESIEAIVIHNLDDTTSTFECSDKLINQLYSNILWDSEIIFY